MSGDQTTKLSLYGNLSARVFFFQVYSHFFMSVSISKWCHNHITIDEIEIDRFFIGSMNCILIVVRNKVPKISVDLGLVKLVMFENPSYYKGQSHSMKLWLKSWIIVSPNKKSAMCYYGLYCWYHKFCMYSLSFY